MGRHHEPGCDGNHTARQRCLSEQTPVGRDCVVCGHVNDVDARACLNCGYTSGRQDTDDPFANALGAAWDRYAPALAVGSEILPAALIVIAGMTTQWDWETLAFIASLALLPPIGLGWLFARPWAIGCSLWAFRLVIWLVVAWTSAVFIVNGDNPCRYSSDADWQGCIDRHEFVFYAAVAVLFIASALSTVALVFRLRVQRGLSAV